MKSRLLAGVGFGMLLLFTSTARADEDRKQEASAQGMGFFTTDSTGNGRTQKSTDTGGFLLSYRYHFNTLAPSSDIRAGPQGPTHNLAGSVQYPRGHRCGRGHCSDEWAIPSLCTGGNRCIGFRSHPEHIWFRPGSG